MTVCKGPEIKIDLFLLHCSVYFCHCVLLFLVSNSFVEGSTECGSIDIPVIDDFDGRGVSKDFNCTDS